MTHLLTLFRADASLPQYQAKRQIQETNHGHKPTSPTAEQLLIPWVWRRNYLTWKPGSWTWNITRLIWQALQLKHASMRLLALSGFFIGTTFLPTEIYWKNKLLSWHSSNLPSWGVTLEDFKFSRNSWPKFYHLPVVYGRKSHVNNVTTLP